MGGRRGNGEGSIYQRSSDGRWLGVASLGYGQPLLGLLRSPSQRAWTWGCGERVNEDPTWPGSNLCRAAFRISQYSSMVKSQRSESTGMAFGLPSPRRP